MSRIMRICLPKPLRQPIPRDVNIWAWLTQLPEPARSKIYLAYGAEDKFAVPNSVLAQYLPANQVVTQAGSIIGMAGIHSTLLLKQQKIF